MFRIPEEGRLAAGNEELSVKSENFAVKERVRGEEYVHHERHDGGRFAPSSTACAHLLLERLASHKIEDVQVRVNDTFMQ